MGNDAEPVVAGIVCRRRFNELVGRVVTCCSIVLTKLSLLFVQNLFEQGILTGLVVDLLAFFCRDVVETCWLRKAGSLPKSGRKSCREKCEHK
jgi:hypothetical protein